MQLNSQWLRAVWFKCNTGRPKSPPVSLSPVASEAVVPNTLRTSWDEDMEVLIKTVFKNEIEDLEVTMETVKNKISYHPQLREENTKPVLDKVRAQWRFRKSSHAGLA